jgi:putative SOS response-associated peptidase YedK
MCGRYVATTPAAVLAAYFEVDELAEEPEGPSFNVAPTDPVPAVAVGRDGRRRLGCLRWGLVPSWSSHARGGARHINARSETVLERPAFRTAFARRRCILPADGFYEWERSSDGRRQAWFIHHRDRSPLALAGLWDVWRAPTGELVRTCAVLTTAANRMMAPVHDRMPVLIDAAGWGDWLDRDNQDVAVLAGLLLPADDGVLVRYPVGPLVNNVRHNGPELLEADRGHPEGAAHR